MKQIPIQLQDHLSRHATTWCYLMRVACVGKYAGRVFGFTSADHGIRYDDGSGMLDYRADNGFMPQNFARAADFGVDNTDVVGWVTDETITDRDILAGMFDSAEVTIYRVNYMNLSAGHEVVEFGSFGETKISGRRWRCEFRSLMQRAKQPFGEVYSLTCRARYGDERCKHPYEWFEGSVVAASGPVQIAVEGLSQDDGYFAPGLIEWLTGDNAGADMDVDDYVDDTVILALPMSMPVRPGDTFRIRRDCPKTFEACKERNNILNFRGEHLTPVADAGLQVPGAHVHREGA